MSDDSGATRRKRIRAVTCVAGAIVAVVASVSAWYWHSRLNPVEIQLLGGWSFARKDGSRVFFLHFQPDRTFSYWTSGTADNNASGTWKIAGDELILSFRNLDHGTPKSTWSLIENEVDRLRNPAAWADYVATFTLEDISQSTIRMRDHRDNAEIVYRRVDSTYQPAPPR
jgi:hypothetical protein